MFGPHVSALLVNADPHRFLVDPQDNVVGRLLYKTGCYRGEELERISQSLRPADRVLVVGTHIGTLAIPLSTSCQSVDAIEANPRTYKLLADNVQLNGCQNMTLHQLAASDARGELQFLASRVNSGGSKVMPKKMAYKYTYDNPDAVTVQADRLDSVFEGRTFDVVVMDIEGAETAALRGMPRLLASCRELYVEFIPHHLRDVAGVTVEQFAEPLRGFERMQFSGEETIHSADQFVIQLKKAYQEDRTDDGIRFSRSMAES